MREFQIFKIEESSAIDLLGELLLGNNLSAGREANIKKNKFSEFGEFVDPRDKNLYHTVKIGEQVWFADNLNFESPESKIFSKNQNYSNNYGRLYHWLDTQNACPPGCRIPDNNDWDDLITTMGGIKAAGAVLIKGHFSIRFGGMALRDNFDYFGQQAHFWSANNFDNLRAFSYTLYKNEVKIHKEVRRKELFYSVRCIRNS
jgi:uncharacterized protein (TIGR02145 family)